MKPKKSSCTDPKYLKNSLKVGEWFRVPRQDEEEFWRLVIPKMGSSKQAMCSCWKKINPNKLTRMEKDAVFELCIQKDKPIQRDPKDDGGFFDDLRDRIGL